jgi:glycosyltransferase involved in cell wall biosynthesis
MRGLLLSKYGTRAASTRQRFTQFEPFLAKQGITLQVEPLLDNQYLDNLFSGRKTRALPVLRAYWRRMRLVLSSERFDFIWVHCELFPYLPRFAERLIEFTKAPVIYDFDDAIFHQYDQHPSRLVRAVYGHKLAPLIRRSAISFCGNTYLEAYASRYGRSTTVIPTTVDITTFRPRDVATESNEVPVVGWMGSPSTWPYCEALSAVLAPYVDAGRIKVLIVGANYAGKATLPFVFRDWSETREISDLQEMDIGIMPVADDPWARGKCGYKLIQYMACGLPVVASPVGVNSTIVNHGVNGFLAATPAEWRQAIDSLLSSESGRQRMGKLGRSDVCEHFSAQVVGPRIARLIRHSVVGAP